MVTIIQELSDVLYDQMAMGVAYHDAEAESHGL
jgi:hypothetical protein